MSVREALSADGAIATLTLDRPDVRNALGPAEWRALDAGVARASATPGVRVLVLTGAGGHFSAGGDVKTMPERLALPFEERRAGLVESARVILRLREIPQPSIAAIDGACVGAGLALALACDLRIASERAKLGATFHRIGLTGDLGILHNLPRVVGYARAIELLLTGELLDAQRAAAIALVHRVVADDKLIDETRSLAERLAAGPPIAMALTREGLARSLAQDLATTIEWEARAQATCSRTADAREGLAALAAKRPPKFTGE